VFYGNDPEFGVFLIILSLFYLPQVNIFIKEKWGFRIPILFKIVLGIFYYMGFIRGWGIVWEDRYDDEGYLIFCIVKPNLVYGIFSTICKKL
jgi:hypothetical protein